MCASRRLSIRSLSIGKTIATLQDDGGRSERSDCMNHRPHSHQGILIRRCRYTYILPVALADSPLHTSSRRYEMPGSYKTCRFSTAAPRVENLAQNPRRVVEIRDVPRRHSHPDGPPCMADCLEWSSLPNVTAVSYNEPRTLIVSRSQCAHLSRDALRVLRCPKSLENSLFTTCISPDTLLTSTYDSSWFLSSLRYLLVAMPFSG